VDFRDAPEMKDLAERARQLGNTVYPKVCALLADGDTDFPRQFDIQFKKRLPNGNIADSPINRIRLNATCADLLSGKPAEFDQVVVHEMAHVAQYYCRPLLGRWIAYNHNPPSHWVEGIADYVCFKLGETNGLRCAQCDFISPDFRSGYSCAGAFLLYVEKTYHSNIVRQLNTRLRHGGYSDEFFASVTGKGLPELWAEFQQTAAFTPNAARMLEFRQSLGYVNGKPPKDIAQRFNALVDQRADTLTKDLLKCARVQGLAARAVQTRMALYLYSTQPGGTAEAFLMKLQKNGKVPGFGEGEKGAFTGLLRPGDLTATFPANRSFTATKRGDSSRYRYAVARDSEDGEWRLQRAWRTDSDGTIAEDYPVQ
jgi:hypothetical protein